MIVVPVRGAPMRKIGFSEIGQASGATAGPIHQRVLPQWQRMGACAARGAVADIHDPDRKRSRRRFDSHGGSLLKMGVIGQAPAGCKGLNGGVALRQ